MTGEMHFDLDTLADLSEGLLDDAAADQVRAHVETCATCAEKIADIGAVTQALASLPMPVMPAAVAARLDSAISGAITGAIAEEAAMTSAVAAGEGGAAVQARRSGRHGTRRRHRWLRPVQAAAAVVAVVGGGGVVVSTLMTDATPSPAPGEAASVQPKVGGTTAKSKETPPYWEQHESGKNYTAKSLPKQVKTLTGEPSGRTVNGRPARKDLTLDACASALASVRGYGYPQSSDRARFDGQPALIFVYDHGPDDYRVVVMDGACGRELYSRDDIPRD